MKRLTHGAGVSSIRVTPSSILRQRTGTYVVSPRAAQAMAIKSRTQRRAAAKRGPDEVVIPDKIYFRIGEVARLCRLPAYVLRFWETEFSQLKPVKSSTGQRMYRRRDVENVVRIKQLLYEEGYTIAGARQHLRD